MVCAEEERIKQVNRENKMDKRRVMGVLSFGLAPPI
jgi:hypothetical protein